MAACIKASSETIGVLQMTAGMGRVTDGEVFVDSCSAALGVVHRKGNGNCDTFVLDNCGSNRRRRMRC